MGHVPVGNYHRLSMRSGVATELPDSAQKSGGDQHVHGSGLRDCGRGSQGRVKRTDAGEAKVPLEDLEIQEVDHAVHVEVALGEGAALAEGVVQAHEVVVVDDAVVIGVAGE